MWHAIVTAAVRLRRRTLYLLARARTGWPESGCPDWVLRALRTAWGNEQWAAGLPLLREIRQAVRETQGTVLECGSGVSTLLAGLLTRGSGRQVVALEHDKEWAGAVTRALARLDCSHVRVIHAPLRDYGDFEWYDTARLSLSGQIGLALVDGPPGETRGGRIGLPHVLGHLLAPHAVLVLDDSAREGEQRVMRAWDEQFGIRHTRTSPCGSVTLLKRVMEGGSSLAAAQSSRAAHASLLRRRLGAIRHNLLEPVRWLRLVGRAVASSRMMTAPNGFGTITCTTYPRRNWAALIALDSVARGSVLPRRLVLFLDRAAYGGKPLPLPIRLASRRGVEVILLDVDDGSYKKLPLDAWDFQDTPLPVITIDDDAVYPTGWLAGLEPAARENPDAVLCYRGRIMRVNPDGTVPPYDSWEFIEDSTPRLAALPTGVGGILYPRSALAAIRDRGTGFRTLAAGADDLWFRFCTLERAIPVQQVLAQSQHFHPIPFTQGESLYDRNVLQGHNDAVLRRLTPVFDLAGLLGTPVSANDRVGDR